MRAVCGIIVASLFVACSPFGAVERSPDSDSDRDPDSNVVPAPPDEPSPPDQPEPVPAGPTGPTQGRAIDVTDFSLISVEVPANVSVSEGKTFQVFVADEADGNVTAAVDGNELTLGGKARASGFFQISIQMPQFVGLSMKKGGAVDITKTSAPSNVQLELKSNAMMRFTGNSAALAGTVSGSGTMSLIGKAASGNLVVSGSGFIDTKEFQCGSCNSMQNTE